jgi:hypothetical protein
MATKLIFAYMVKQLHTRPQWQRASNGTGRNNDVSTTRRVYSNDPIQHLTESQMGAIN